LIAIKKTLGEKLFDIFNLFFMILILFITLFPFWNQVVTSLSGGFGAYSSGVLLLPRKFSLDAYKLVFEYPQLWVGFKNSIIRTILGTIISVIFTALTAYPLSKSKLPFNRLCTGLITFTMLFNGGLIPNYLLIIKLGMMDTIWSLIIPTMIGAWNVLIMRNFFMSIPESMEESAKIDGASYLKIFIKIVLPLSLPVIATVSLWVAVGHWNSWFDAMIYMKSKDKIVLQGVLQRIIIENNSNDIGAILRKTQGGKNSDYTGRQLQAAIILIATIPMLMAYPFVQKYFIKGIMIGAIKG
jgi:ABC-type sugar transport system, permease component